MARSESPRLTNDVAADSQSSNNTLTALGPLAGSAAACGVAHVSPTDPAHRTKAESRELRVCAPPPAASFEKQQQQL